MQSFDDVSVVGTGLPDNAKYDLVDNHGAELTCNMVTDLGTKVDDDGIALIRSSIMSELQIFQCSYIQKKLPLLLIT